MKFAQQTITQKFASGRNSDTYITKVQNSQMKKAGPPQQVKPQNKLKNNLMLDANSTFMAVERSRSGIGAMASPGMISPLGGGANFASIQNQHQLHIFNSTVARNLRGRTNSNLNQASSGMKGQMN